MGTLGGPIVSRVVAAQAGHGKALDARLGFALLRDRRVPRRSKALAFLLGAAGMGILIALEIPWESVVAAVLPVLGLATDLVIDGTELVGGPLLIAVLLLPHLAPRDVVDAIRAERSGAPRVATIGSPPT